MAEVVSKASYFRFDADAARQQLRRLLDAVSTWRQVAQTPEVGMTRAEADAFGPAFDQPALRDAKSLAQ